MSVGRLGRVGLSACSRQRVCVSAGVGQIAEGRDITVVAERSFAHSYYVFSAALLPSYSLPLRQLLESRAPSSWQDEGQWSRAHTGGLCWKPEAKPTECLARGMGHAAHWR